MKQIAVIGSTNVDLVSYIDRMPVGGETRPVSDFQIVTGGKGANQAVAASKLGGDVLFLTATGTDSFGEMCRSKLTGFGIRKEGLFTVEGATGSTCIVVEENGENRILINKAANGKLTSALADSMEAELAKSSLIVLQLEIPLETVYHLIEFGRRHAIPVLLNPAPAIPDLELEKVVQCDFFVPNQSELSLLIGRPLETMEEIVEAAKELIAKGLKHVIVTIGSRGALYVSAETNGAVQIPPVKVTAVDTTGAGDAFIGAFAECWVRTKDIRQSLERAVSYSAQSVTRKGTQEAYLTKEEFASAEEK
ncbi:ribokinase [Selenomonas sp. TAMA-11512]|uniref:ribokinase n=1 Tax=Selenomonas sp. TAMA-11512 TaxID=3095337 RepID=UPI0030D53AD4